MEVLIPITLFLSIAAVAILRPLTKKLGSLLEVIAQERTRARTDQHETDRIVALLEHMSRRMELMEERLDFTERLVSARRTEPRRSLPRAAEAGLRVR